MYDKMFRQLEDQISGFTFDQLDFYASLCLNTLAVPIVLWSENI